MPTRMLARAAAALTGIGAAAHLVLAVLSLGISMITAILMVAMSGWCLRCTRELWLRPSARSWGYTALGGIGMIALHLVLMTMPSGASGHHHAATVEPSHRPMVDLGGVMNLAIGATAVAECVLVIGLVVASMRDRRVRMRVRPTPRRTPAR